MTVYIDGVSLDDSRYGWSHRATSEPLPVYVDEWDEDQTPGMDGVDAGPGWTVPVEATIVVSTPRRYLTALLFLFRHGKSMSWGDGLEAGFRYRGIKPTGYGPADEWVDAAITVRFPRPFWRGMEPQTFTAALDAASVVLPVFPARSGSAPWDGGLSATIQDGVVRVKGAATGIQLSDSSGAFLLLPDLDEGQFVRFDMSTGAAFLTETDTWEGGINVGGQVDYGGPRRRFEITPTFTPGDPDERTGLVTVSTTTRDGAVAQVRARDAQMLWRG